MGCGCSAIDSPAPALHISRDLSQPRTTRSPCALAVLSPATDPRTEPSPGPRPLSALSLPEPPARENPLRLPSFPRHSTAACTTASSVGGRSTPRTGSANSGLRLLPPAWHDKAAIAETAAAWAVEGRAEEEAAARARQIRLTRAGAPHRASSRRSSQRSYR